VNRSTEAPAGKTQSLPQVVIEDLRRGDLRRTVGRDVRDLYAFYLDEDARARLARMSRLKRGVMIGLWLARSLVLNMTPARRILLLASMLFFLQGDFVVRMGDAVLNFNFSRLGYFVLLFVFMLELKDKLLARNELEVGRAVQRALLPEGSPEFPGWDVWLFTRPANDVGGDLVDYLQIDADRLGLALGDVAGKGLGAALLMSKLQATWRALATRAASLSDLGAAMNEIFWRDQVAGRYATLVYLEIFRGSGTVRVLNAGHLPPVVLGPRGVQEMEPVAQPIGILPDARFTEQRVDLAPQETLLVYSDGVTEARNREGEFFGEDRLFGILPRMRGLEPRIAAEVLLAEVARFMGEERYPDDLSLILLRRKPSDPASGG
jgi:hypothetical protein